MAGRVRRAGPAARRSERRGRGRCVPQRRGADPVRQLGDPPERGRRDHDRTAAAAPGRAHRRRVHHAHRRGRAGVPGGAHDRGRPAEPAGRRLARAHPADAAARRRRWTFDEATARADPGGARDPGARLRRGRPAGWRRPASAAPSTSPARSRTPPASPSRAGPPRRRWTASPGCRGADGVARLAGGRLADLDGAVLGARAAAKARAGGQPIELPPGRYEVVLEPDAVADLLSNLATFGFNGKAYAQRQSFAELGRAAVRLRGDHRRRGARQRRPAAAVAAVRPGGHAAADRWTLVRDGTTVGGDPRPHVGGRGRRGLHRSRHRRARARGARSPATCGWPPAAAGECRRRRPVRPRRRRARWSRTSSAACSSPTSGTPGCSTRRAWSSPA